MLLCKRVYRFRFKISKFCRMDCVDQTVWFVCFAVHVWKKLRFALTYWVPHWLLSSRSHCMPARQSWEADNRSNGYSCLLKDCMFEMHFRACFYFIYLFFFSQKTMTQIYAENHLQEMDVIVRAESNTESANSCACSKLSITIGLRCDAEVASL